MNYLSTNYWLEVMKDKIMEEGLAVAVVRTTPNEIKKLPTGNSCGSISHHHYNGPNHFVKDHAQEGGNPRYDVTSATWWAVYPIIVLEMNQRNIPQC